MYGRTVQAVYSNQEEKIKLMGGRMNAGLDKLDEVSSGTSGHRLTVALVRRARPWRS
jgi:hypothetical protein